uniref:Family with sequence similarity 210 member B n=1 Tax=Salvator merianae TaxID=96440 RepID=A0A8D0DLP5_SALMN
MNMYSLARGRSAQLQKQPGKPQPTLGAGGGTGRAGPGRPYRAKPTIALPSIRAGRRRGAAVPLRRRKVGGCFALARFFRRPYLFFSCRLEKGIEALFCCSPLAAMLGLGRPPCALHALFPGPLLLHHVASRAAAGGILSGQVRFSPGVSEQDPSRRTTNHWSSRLRLQPAAAVGFLISARELQGLMAPLPQPQREAAALCPLPAAFALTAPGRDFPVGQDRSSPGSRKDIRESLGNDCTNPSQENGKKPNKSQQLKKVFKEYGAVAVVFHVGISLVSLGMFYLAVSSGVDMTVILYKLGFDEAVVQSKLAAGTSTFVLAYAVHKLFAPVRISITLVSVPLLVRYFRKIGFFKPPAPNP